MNRYERELQQVQLKKGETVAFDWTFQAIKNYSSLPGAKCIFTALNGTTKEIVTAAMVSSTAVREVAHLLVEAKKNRKFFSPSLLYTDTCPANNAFFERIFGQGTKQKLGLFHLMHRIVDTLDGHSKLYWDALVKLKDCFYRVHPEDEGSLLRALKDGTFSRTGEKLDDLQIQELRHSKQWKQRYSQYL